MPRSTSLKPTAPREAEAKTRLRILVCATTLLLLAACSVDTPPAPETSTDGSEPTAGPEPTTAEPETDLVELEYWKTIKDSEHTEDFWSYLEKYPNGAFADLAKSRIERLAAGNGKTTLHGGSDSRASRGDIVRAAIDSELRGFGDRRLHLAPNIPRFKLDNVANLHGLDSRRVILLYDDGSGGGGKTGFCLTDRRMYWRFVAGSENYYLDYEDIGQVRAGRTSFSVNGYDVPTTLASNSREAAERFADLVERIARDMRRR